MSSLQRNSLGTLERRGIGKHDLVAFAQAAADLDLGDADAAHLDRPQLGDAVLYHVGLALAERLEERTALHLEHVAARLQHQLGGDALVLLEARRRLAAEADD